MKRAVALALLASAVVWAAVFVEPRGSHTPPEAASVSSAPQPGDAPSSGASVPQRAAPAQAPERASSPAPEAQAAASSAPSARGPERARAPQGRVVVLGSGPLTAQGRQQQVAEQERDEAAYEALVQRGELAEGLRSERFTKLEAQYVDEPRDGLWALHVEQEAREALREAGLGERILTVHCQTTVCRVGLDATDDPDVYAKLMQAPGLADLLRLETSTPYSLNHAELVIYGTPARPTALFAQPAEPAPE